MKKRDIVFYSISCVLIIVLLMVATRGRHSDTEIYNTKEENAEVIVYNQKTGHVTHPSSGVVFDEGDVPIFEFFDMEIGSDTFRVFIPRCTEYEKSLIVKLK